MVNFQVPCWTTVWCRKQLKQLGTIPPARNEFGQMDHVLFADACSVISMNGARKRRNPVLRVEME